MKIEYWGDFTCPYTYIGSSNLKQALKNLNLDAEILMHSYELNPDMPSDKWESTLKQLMEKDGMTEEEAQKQIESVNDYGRQSGLPIHFGKEHFCNTRDAHRLVTWAQSIDTKAASELVSALFHANFAENKTLSDPEVLLEAVKAVGLDVDVAREVLNSDAFLDDVLAQEKKAEQIPIETIPYFIIDGHVVDTSMPVEGFEKELNTIISRKN